MQMLRAMSTGAKVDNKAGWSKMVKVSSTETQDSELEW